MDDKKKSIPLIIVYISIALVLLTGMYFLGRTHAASYQSEQANTIRKLTEELTGARIELEFARKSLVESRIAVGKLEDMDFQRAARIGRIYGIIDDAGKSVSGITDGERRARIAFEAIARIVDILEEEFGRCAE